ncbi:carbohydrate ABC transporter ATP-binding protein (CUT1 family) [Rhodovulum bhavnagarense]|uniref:Carbohydrate ABC transporter ATP-binding protein (CUT1 family) n=1 Tax=Rhodovulum bhavnagarense TaxID=992286 RepID=A0A4R2RB11_9RHOB|nr:ABC transporter ATP-binding protein [Rhodovulum bhavnagarense]TCP60500.1 carbohydrate ABC transporter ATP-binding protein (CUT1 family) [Rhodovulum bhavnagarense]
MSDPAYVALDGVTRQWGGRGGVADVSLDVAEGSFVSVLGPSGCGKSTLLRLISGLETPEAGSIHINGREVTHLQASGRGLSMVFQSYALFPHLSVRENILFGMRVRRVPRNARDEKLAEAVAMLGLEGLEGRKPAALSGGQRQRVALARAVVSGHPLCLMDEPLSNLDAKLRHSVRRDIKGLQRRLGLTVIYVTHDQTEAMSLSDQVVLMRDGRVEQVGSPRALYADPVSTFAAEFIGDPPMAIIEGAALGVSGALIGLRPEHLALAPSGQGDLTGVVREVEYMGAETHLIVDHPAARGLILSVPGHAAWQPGQEISLTLPKEHRVLFDAQTGKAKKDPQQDYGGDRRQTAPRDSRKALQSHPSTD